jgi:hypothetical protein
VFAILFVILRTEAASADRNVSTVARGKLVFFQTVPERTSAAGFQPAASWPPYKGRPCHRQRWTGPDERRCGHFEPSETAVSVEITRGDGYFRAGEPNLGGRMIRGLFRFIGVLLLAAGFIFLIYDGQRSIADQTLRLTRLGEFWNDIHQSSQKSLQMIAEANAPWLWDSAGKFILNQPTWAVLGVVGILLMLLFRPRRRLIGYARD